MTSFDQAFLWKAAQARAHPLMGTEPHGHIGTDFHPGVSDISVQLQMWERKSRYQRQIKQESKEKQSLWCHSLHPSRGEDERLCVRFSSLLFSCSRYQFAPWGAEAQGCCDYLLLFVYVHFEETCERSCLGCLRQRKWISGEQLILLGYFWARWNRKMNLCPLHCLNGMYLFILHFNAPLTIYGVSLNEFLIENW